MVMANPDSYFGLVQQIGSGVFITKSAKLTVIRAGEGQEARHLWIALLGGKTLLELEYDIGRVRLTARIQLQTPPDAYIAKINHSLQQELGYAAINGTPNLEGLFLRTPDTDLDMNRGIEGVVETLFITNI